MDDLLLPAVALTDLALKYGSDKGVGHSDSHGYTRIYEALLGGQRLAPWRILEVGLLRPRLQQELGGRDAYDRCPSLDMWADYLPHARIFGWDILDFSGYVRSRVSVCRADQGNRDSLVASAIACGGDFDLIIDDGSHAAHHQQITLGVLFPFLRPGGLYVIEDLHDRATSAQARDISHTQTLLRVFEQHRTFGEIPAAFTADERRLLEREVANVSLFDSLLGRAPFNPFGMRDSLAVLRRGHARQPHACANACLRWRRVRGLLDGLAEHGCNWNPERPLLILGTGPAAKRVHALLSRLSVDARVVDRDLLHAGAGESLGRPTHAAPFFLLALGDAIGAEQQLLARGSRRGADHLVVDGERLDQIEANLPADGADWYDGATPDLQLAASALASEAPGDAHPAASPDGLSQLAMVSGSILELQARTEAAARSTVELAQARQRADNLNQEMIRARGRADGLKLELLKFQERARMLKEYLVQVEEKHRHQMQEVRAQLKNRGEQLQARSEQLRTRNEQLKVWGEELTDWRASFLAAAVPPQSPAGVWLWGANELASLVRDRLAARGIAVRGVVDRRGGEAMTPDQFFATLATPAVPGLVVICSASARDEIAAVLEAKGLKSGNGYIALPAKPHGSSRA